MNLKPTQQEIDYTLYVCEHVENVKAVWRELSNNLCKGEFWIEDYSYFGIDALIKQHDRSKLDNDEFNGYRQWFFPEVEGQKFKPAFDAAWNHHQKHNQHHWQYWLMWKPEGTEALPMPFEYVVEMLCDWSAMSLKFGDTPSGFYAGQKDKILLHENARGCVERWLPLFDKAVENIRDHLTIT